MKMLDSPAGRRAGFEAHVEAVGVQLPVKLPLNDVD